MKRVKNQKLITLEELEARVYKLETIVKILAEKMKVNIEELAGAE